MGDARRSHHVGIASRARGTSTSAQSLVGTGIVRCLALTRACSIASDRGRAVLRALFYPRLPSALHGPGP
eukprot:scaffold141789_cov32-Tisochrysis_lutea.AAC.5